MGDKQCTVRIDSHTFDKTEEFGKKAYIASGGGECFGPGVSTSGAPDLTIAPLPVQLPAALVALLASGTDEATAP